MTGADEAIKRLCGFDGNGGVLSFGKVYAPAMDALGNEQGTAAIREQLREEGFR